MNKSEGIQNLAAALSKAQAELPAIKFDSVNPFLKNGYASLGAVIAGSRSVLAKNGLAVTQLTFGEDGVVGVETMLTHSSGEWISDRVSMQVGGTRQIKRPGCRLNCNLSQEIFFGIHTGCVRGRRR